MPGMKQCPCCCKVAELLPVHCRGVIVTRVCRPCQKEIHSLSTEVKKDSTWIACQIHQANPYIDMAGLSMERARRPDIQGRHSAHRLELFAERREPEKVEPEAPCWGEWEKE